jgi:hypothetical protein
LQILSLQIDEFALVLIVGATSARPKDGDDQRNLFSRKTNISKNKTDN